MELIYELHEGSQAEKPKTVDTTSSATVVYLRKNIKQITRSDDMGEITLWQYEEAQCTHEQFEEILNSGITSLEETTASTNDALDTVLTEELPAQTEQIQTVSDAVDYILTDVIPGILEG